MTVEPVNPYAGPQSLRYGDPIYGRDQMIDQLFDTLIAQRVVLLYSPSGAGKSSLVEAGLRPKLGAEGFRVLPSARVGGPVGTTGGANRYLDSVVHTMDARYPDGVDVTADDALARVLDGLDDGDRELCLVIDQFEELFTVDPTDVDGRSTFVRQLGHALRDRSRWALLAMREDYIAQLDPYVSEFPRRLAARLRLELLSPEAAVAAAGRPAANLGVEFASDAVNRLVDDLRRIRSADRGDDRLSPFVEPVILQVACRRLWERAVGDHDPMGADPPIRIDVDDVEALGDIDDALAGFCDGAFGSAAAATDQSERTIREWAERALLGPHSERRQVQVGPGTSGATVVEALAATHLVRAETRRGTTWYEIAHDRLVSPLRRSNVRFRDTHDNEFQTEARHWDELGRPDEELVLRGRLLDQALAWAQQHPDELGEIDRDFLAAGEAARRRRRRERGVLVAALSLCVASVIAAVVAYSFWRATLADRNDRGEALSEVIVDQLSEAERLSAEADALSSEAASALVAAQAAKQDARDALAEARQAGEQALAEARALAQQAENAAAEAEDLRIAAEQVEARAAQAQATAGAIEEAAVDAGVSVTTTTVATTTTLLTEPAAEWDGRFVRAPFLTTTQPLQLGHRGFSVFLLEGTLADLGYAVEPGLNFDRETEAAVLAFQVDRCLSQTGRANNNVWTQLPIAVAEVQEALVAAGERVEVDGAFGRETTSALRAFQRKAGLAPSGTVDEETAAALELTGVCTDVAASAEAPKTTD